MTVSDRTKANVLTMWNRGVASQGMIAQTYGLTTNTVAGLLNRARGRGEYVRCAVTPEQFAQRNPLTDEQKAKALDLWNTTFIPASAIAKDIGMPTKDVASFLGHMRRKGLTRKRKNVWQ